MLAVECGVVVSERQTTVMCVVYFEKKGLGCWFCRVGCNFKRDFLDLRFLGFTSGL